jgi:PAS domain S-box-containing protein
MIDFFKRLFDSDVIPHGQAHLMRPEIIWLHVFADGLLALAYFSILVALAYFVRTRRDLPHYGMFVLFGFFVFACGAAHLMEIWSVWYGTFRLAGVVKATAGIASVATVILLVRLVPQALKVPAPEELRQTRSALASEVAERERAQGLLSGANDSLKLQIEERAAELRAMAQLHEFSMRLFATSESQSLPGEVLAATMALQEADFGTLQLFNPETRALEIVAHRGLPQDNLDDLRSISESSAGFGRALEGGEPFIIEDVLSETDFEGYRAIAASAGFRGLQSTALCYGDGESLGIISTYFRQPHRPSERALRLATLCAQQAAQTIEREYAVKAKMESDTRLRELIEGVKEYAIFMLDPAGRVIMWNAGAERIEGFGAQEILGKHFSALYEPGDIELGKPAEAIRLAIEEGRFEGETLRVQKDGSRFWAKTVLTALKDEAGTLRGIAGVTRDVTERKQAEEELRRSESYLTEAQKLSQTGSWGWNLSGGEMFWSRETFRIFGVDPRDVKPSYQLLLQFVHPEDRPLVERSLERAKRDGSEFKAEFRIVLPDGSIKHLRSLGHPAPKESGLTEFVGAIIDVTEQKLAGEAFSKAQAELARLTMGEFATSIAHEVSQPLDAIVSNGDFCLRLAEATRASPYEAREALLEIVKDANRVGAVIAQAQENARKPKPEMVALDVSELVLNVLALAAHALKQNRITVQTELAEDLPCVLGDRSELQQVLLSLVMNAVEAMSAETDERRLLTISTAPDELDSKGAVRIAVQDCGTGLESKAIDRLFDAFYSTKPNRMGMGLRISRVIVEAHGGRLSATQKCGPGATFTCVLPVSDES